MKLSGGGQNGQEGQVDETLRWVGVAVHVQWDTSHDLWNLSLMFI